MSNNEKETIAATEHFQKTIPNYTMQAISGGVARDVIKAMERQLQELFALHCRGRSATEQGSGVQHPTAATTGVTDLEGEMTTTKDKNFCTFLLGTVLIIRWMLNDCFVRGRTMMGVGDYELTMRAVARVFLEAMEMGSLAKQFPRVAFAIGACADTWKVGEACECFANAARLGVALAGNNVASGVHDHASVSELLFEDNWRYSKGAEAKAAIVMTSWLVREAEYAFMIASGLHTYPRNYADAGVGVALVAEDAGRKHDHGQGRIRTGQRRRGHQPSTMERVARRQGAAQFAELERNLRRRSRATRCYRGRGSVGPHQGHGEQPRGHNTSIH
jgi:hypothetical protein